MFELMPFTRSRGVDLYHPFRDLEELERNLFSSNGAAAFKTDIRDAGDAYVLEADLPGMKKEDIHIDIDGERLSISEEISAAYEDGVLKLTLPKQAKAIPASRRLEIQ